MKTVLYPLQFDATGRIYCRDENDALLIAAAASLHSPCQSKRGAVIWANGKAIVWGCNHLPGNQHCDGSDACKAVCRETAIHAEQHAILHCDKPLLFGAQMLHVKTVDGVVVASGPPSCKQCSKFILESGITYMWLLHNIGLARYSASEFHRRTLQYYGLPDRAAQEVEPIEI